jgi:hypothetical protein
MAGRGVVVSGHTGRVSRSALLVGQRVIFRTLSRETQVCSMENYFVESIRLFPGLLGTTNLVAVVRERSRPLRPYFVV